MFVLLFEQSFICSSCSEEQDQQQDANLSDNHMVTPGSVLWCPGVSYTRETRGQICRKSNVSQRWSESVQPGLKRSCG